MEIKSATYLKSSEFISQCPEHRQPEYAFIGRSNVGKSSLINMLTNNRKLAKTSATPGKTLLINHFLIHTQPSSTTKNAPTPLGAATPLGKASPLDTTSPLDTPTPLSVGGGTATAKATAKTTTKSPTKAPTSWYLVDLPGYGFAKRSKTERARLEKMISSYILQRECLTNLFVLIDCRHEPQAVDLEFMRWLGESNIPFSIVFTKADKLSRVKLNENVNAYLNRLAEEWDPLPPHFVTSAENRLGREELLAYIEEINTEISIVTP